MKTTATLTVEYNHDLRVCLTFHTIITTFEGPETKKLQEILSKDLYVSLADDGTLRHGQYVYIALGLRNMIFRLLRAGMAWDEIYTEGKTADKFVDEVFPDRNYVKGGIPECVS